MSINIHPNLHSLITEGLAYHGAGHLDEANKLYQKILNIAPDNLDVRYLLALTFLQKQAHRSALIEFSNVLKLNPSHGLSHWHIATAFSALELHEAAFVSFSRARKVAPSHIDAYIGEARELWVLGQTEAAIAVQNQALAEDSLRVDLHIGLGDYHRALQRQEIATTCYKNGLIVTPDNPPIYSNLGNALRDCNHLNKAIWCHDRAQLLEPKNQIPALNQSLVRLLKGEMRQGWNLYEARWDVLLQDERRYFRQPRWTGKESLEGKVIFIHSEQGYGDTIQFCRYIPLLAEMGAFVIFEVSPQLKSLMGSLKGVGTLLTKGGTLPLFDMYCPLLSLPLAMDTSLESIPAEVPYLSADRLLVEKWYARLGPRRSFRIGIAWSGGNSYRNDRNRSMPLEVLAPIFALPFEFHIIQNIIQEQDSIFLERFPQVYSHTENLTDFSETAALLSEMDLIVSVDTSVAHLAGSLNIPVWIMLPYTPDFRWLLQRYDSPWYQSARLFRQSRRGYWSDVVDDIIVELKNMRKTWVVRA